MTDAELRALVRDAVARHLGGRENAEPAPQAHAPATLPSHASHAVYVQLVNPGHACVIEPDVECSHCNYCKSHGY